MDTCFPLLKLKHHCVRATGEKRNQPTERGEERERRERSTWEPLLELTGTRRLREDSEPCRRGLSHGRAPLSPCSCHQLRRRALNSRFHFIPYFSCVSRACETFQSRWGEENPHLRVGLVLWGVFNNTKIILAGIVYILEVEYLRERGEGGKKIKKK